MENYSHSTLLKKSGSKFPKYYVKKPNKTTK